jgi:hypothetical protein
MDFQFARDPPARPIDNVHAPVSTLQRATLIIANDCTSNKFNFDSLQAAIVGAAHFGPRARHFSLSRCFFVAKKNFSCVRIVYLMMSFKFQVSAWSNEQPTRR